MNKAILALCLAMATSTAAFAQDKARDMDKKAAPAVENSAKGTKAPSEKQKAQQDRMKDCNAKASGKKGDERKQYMSACLKGEADGPSARQKAQQDKMTSCNKAAGAKNLKGDERKTFMSGCLKG